MTNAEAIETLRANYPDTCFEQLRCAVDMAIKALEEPQRKKGKWINHRCDDGHHIADCDQCGHSLQWFDDDIPKYCCECGADMREPEDIPMEYFESGGR